MTATQRRFHSLARLFTHRLIDSEMLASNAEPHRTLVAAVALLGGLGFTLTLVLVLRFMFLIGGLPADSRNLAVWSDQLLLLLIGVTVTGLLASFAWNSIFPSRRDAFILGALPVPQRTLTGARLYSLALYLGVLMFALHALPLLVAPLLSQLGGASLVGVLRAYAAHAVTVTMLGLCVFASAILAQSLLLLVLPWRIFERVSPLVQIAVLLASFATLFVHPGVHEVQGAARHWTHLLPPFWFLDLWHAISGGERLFAEHTRNPLAQWAVIATAVSVFGALGGVYFGLPRAMRKAVEGLQPRQTGPSAFSRLSGRFIDRVMLRDPRERAVFWFAAWTVVRHRGHRLLLCVYGGLALSATLLSVSSLIYGRGRWSEPSGEVIGAMFFLSLLMIAGMRAIYSLPVEVNANWVFQFAAGQDARPLTGGARKLIRVAGLAPLALLAPALMMLWGNRPAAVALTWVVLIALAFSEYLMKDFNKIPFACAWLPGEANTQVNLGIWFISLSAGVAFFSSVGSFLVLRAEPANILTWFGIASAAWLYPVFNRWREASSRLPVIYEPRPKIDVSPIQLNS